MCSIKKSINGVKNKNRIYIISLLLFLLALFYICHISSNNSRGQAGSLFYINTSPSIPRGIYLRVPMLALQRQDYVVYRPTEECISTAMSRGWINNQDTLFIKHIGGLSGDVYEVDKTYGFYILHQYYGHISEYDACGQSIPCKYGSYIVPDSMFLPAGDSPKSFDGRYTGPVPRDNIQAKVVPFITEGILDIF